MRPHTRRIASSSVPAWARRLLPPLERLAVPERQVLAWLTPKRPEAFGVDQFPVFILDVDAGSYYGFPAHDGHGLKIGWYHHLSRAHRPRRPRSVDAAGRRGRAPLLRRALPARCGRPDRDAQGLHLHQLAGRALHRRPVAGCPTGKRLLRRVGARIQVLSVIGEIMADLALDAPRATTSASSVGPLFRLNPPPSVLDSVVVDEDCGQVGGQTPSRSTLTGPTIRPGRASCPGHTATGIIRSSTRTGGCYRMTQRSLVSDAHRGTIRRRNSPRPMRSPHPFLPPSPRRSWPELYDEMCGVAARREFNGWDSSRWRRAASRSPARDAPTRGGPGGPGRDGPERETDGNRGAATPRREAQAVA